MNKIKRIAVFFVFGVFAIGSIASATTNRMGSAQIIDSHISETNSVQLPQEFEAHQSDEFVTLKETKEHDKLPKWRRINPWIFVVPAALAIAATGGLAAVPLLTGAVSAETAMGLALAAAVL